MSDLIDGKKICDLRVVDLRSELEKRGLVQSGTKAILVDRLTQAIQKESGGSGDNVSKTVTLKTEAGGVKTEVVKPVKTVPTTECSNEKVVVKIETLVTEVDEVNEDVGEGESQPLNPVPPDDDAHDGSEKLNTENSNGLEDPENPVGVADEEEQQQGNEDATSQEDDDTNIDQEDDAENVDQEDDNEENVDQEDDNEENVDQEDDNEENVDQEDDNDANVDTEVDDTVVEDSGTMEEENVDTVEEEGVVDTMEEEEGDTSVGADGSGATDEGTECQEEEEEVGNADDEGDDKEEPAVDADADASVPVTVAKSSEEVTETKDTAASKPDAFDDEMDQDALRLTIGEDEEDDKKFMLDEERERDKAEDDDVNEVQEVKGDKEKSTVDVKDGGVGSGSAKKKPKQQSSVSNKSSSVKGAATTTAKDSSKVKKGDQKEKATKSNKVTKPASAASAEAIGEKVKKTVVKDTTTAPESGTATTSSEKTSATNSHSKTKSGKDSKDATNSGSTQKAKDVKASTVKDADPKKSSRVVAPPARTSKTIVVPRVPATKRRSISPRTRSHFHASRHSALSFEHIRELRERERQRERELEWRRREREQHWNRDSKVRSTENATKKNEDALNHVHKRRMQDLERRNAEELAQLEREREKLRLEREKVEREKQKIIRMMQERTRVERDLIEKEKDDLRRTQVRVVDERLSRSHKRPFVEDDSKERARSREYSDRKKLAVEPRRFEHHSFDAPIISASSTRTVNPRIAVVERRDPTQYVRDNRDQRIRHRSKSRSYSPVRERAAAVYAPREVGWERERTASRDSHHREKQVDLKRDVPDVRHQRIARDRAMLGPTPPPPPRRPVQADYPVTATRSEGYHRAIAIPIVKMRPPERFDVKNVRQSDSTYDSRGDDTWMRRASYSATTTSSAQVQHQQLPSSSTGRDWMTERKSDWPVVDSRLTVRGVNGERWVSGSGNAISSMRSGSGIPLVAPPPPIFHQHTTSASSSAATHPYVNDRYGGYNSKSTVIRRY